jgi:hypothetical protein
LGLLVVACTCWLPSTAAAASFFEPSGPINFGGIQVGESGNGNVRIVNEGSESVHTLNFSSTSSNFGFVSHCPGELHSFEACEIEISFSPQSEGAKTGKLLAKSGNSLVAEIALEGTGAGMPVLEVTPPSKDLGSVVLGEVSSIEVLTFKNAGSGSLKIGSLELTGPGDDEFGISADGCSSTTLPSGQSCEIEVFFEAATAGPRDAELVVNTNTLGGTTVVDLTGEGVAPLKELSISPAEWSFGSVKVGASASSHTFVVENTGNQPVVASAAELAGPDVSAFSLSSAGCAGQTLRPGETCEITAGFAPTSKGAKNAELTIGGEGSGVTPALAMLTGTGTEDEATGTGTGGGGGAAQSTGTTPATGQSAPVSPPSCKVPKLKGKKLEGAKKALRAANCKLGKVTKTKGVTGKTGKVVKQSVKTGAQKTAGTKVNVKLA